MRRMWVVAVLLSSLIIVLLAAVGCGNKSEPAAQQDKTGQSAGDETQESKEPKTLKVGDTISVQGGKITLSKVTVTSNLASPEAEALLLTGEPGESKNPSKAPSSGNEFLLITFICKNTVPAIWIRSRLSASV